MTSCSLLAGGTVIQNLLILPQPSRTCCFCSTSLQISPAMVRHGIKLLYLATSYTNLGQTPVSWKPINPYPRWLKNFSGSNNRQNMANTPIKVSKGAKIRNRYNQVPHLTQDTNGKVTNSQLDTINESQEVSPFPAGDHKAHINRRARRQQTQDRKT